MMILIYCVSDNIRVPINYPNVLLLTIFYFSIYDVINANNTIHAILNT